MTRFSTRDEAIDREIIDPIEAGAVEDARAEYDIDTIADQVLSGHETGYAPTVTADEFWQIVEAHPARRLTWVLFTGEYDFLVAERLEDGEWVEVAVESIEACEDEEPYDAAERAMRARLGDEWVDIIVTTNA